jgi:hypothetical protein
MCTRRSKKSIVLNLILVLRVLLKVFSREVLKVGDLALLWLFASIQDWLKVGNFHISDGTTFSTPVSDLSAVTSPSLTRTASAFMAVTTPSAGLPVA